jgi:prevent-host-death family protein
MTWCLPLAQGRPIKASECKAKCLQLTDQVERTGEPLVITKSGRPIAQLGPLQLLTLPADAGRQDLLGSGLHEVAIDGRIGIRAAELEQLHRDPADRLIVASAIELGAQLPTADHRILVWAGNLLRVDAWE